MLTSAFDDSRWATPTPGGTGDYLTRDGLWWRMDLYTKLLVEEAERPLPGVEHQLPVRLTAQQVATLLYDAGYTKG